MGIRRPGAAPVDPPVQRRRQRRERPTASRRASTTEAPRAAGPLSQARMAAERKDNAHAYVRHHHRDGRPAPGSRSPRSRPRGGGRARCQRLGAGHGRSGGGADDHLPRLGQVGGKAVRLYTLSNGSMKVTSPTSAASSSRSTCPTARQERRCRARLQEPQGLRGQRRLPSSRRVGPERRTSARPSAGTPIASPRASSRSTARRTTCRSTTAPTAPRRHQGFEQVSLDGETDRDATARRRR